MSLRKQSTLVAILTFVSTCNGKSISGDSIPSSTFLWLSDLHIDGYYGSQYSSGSACNDSYAPAYGVAGCDSPIELVSATLKAAAEVVPNPEFVLITGDYLRHNDVDTPMAIANDTEGYHQYIYNTIKRATALINTYFPDAKTVHITDSMHTPEMHTQQVIMLGNNDFEGDYELSVNNTQPENPWLTQLSSHIRGQLTEEQHNTFAYGGYYSGVVIPGLHVVSLNTVVYSPNHNPATAAADTSDPFEQFKWLNATLKNIREAGEHVLITGHIPPSYDSYGPSLQWQAQYITAYLNIVAEYKDVIKAQLFGHIHSSEMRAHADSDTYGEAPFLITGAISPVYRNAPMFAAVEIDLDSKSIQDYAIHAALGVCSDELDAEIARDIKETSRETVRINRQFPIVTWNPIFESARDYFDLSEISNSALYKYIENLSTDDEAWRKWMYQYKQGNVTPCDTECRQNRVCAFQSFSKEMYDICRGSSSTTQ